MPKHQLHIGGNETHVLDLIKIQFDFVLIITQNPSLK